MTGKDLFRKLIVRAPSDLGTAIYDRVRQSREVEGEGPSWQEIARQAQQLGILTAEETGVFLQVIADGPLEPPPL